IAEDESKSGDCAVYIDSKVKNDGKTPCKQYCKARGQPEDKIGCVSEHVANGKGPYPTDTDGNEYLPGKCKCAEDIDPIAEAFAIPIIESLAKLDNIICGVFVQAVVEAVNIGFAFVPGGQGVTAARTATKAAVQGAKSFAENAMTSYDFFDGWVKKGCGLEKIELDYQKTFDSLVDAPDSLGTSTGCKRKERGRCKTQPARPDPKTTDKKADPPKTTDKKDDSAKPTPTPTTSKQDDAAKTTTTKPADAAGPNTTAGSDRGLPPGSDKPQATSSGTTTTSSSAAPGETAVTCELCSSKNAKKAARDARWGSMFAPRAAGEACLLDKGPKVGDGESCAADGPRRRGLLSERSLSRADPFVTFNGKNFWIDCGMHKPCGEAKGDSSIDKYYYLTEDSKCGGDMTFGNALTIGNKEFQNDHVFEKQILTLFFGWLGDGSTTPIGVGLSTKPRPAWVADVILDENSGRNFKIPANPSLGNPGNGATLDTVMAYGLARSDPLDLRTVRGGGLPLSMTSRNFALLEKDINLYKGVFFKEGEPRAIRGKNQNQQNKNRNWIRQHAAVFQYLSYNHAANANKENVWNKWMRVSNWVDLALHEFDRTYPWG
ncbi:hypothetical protein CSOJ01_12781, partial [Colletotrichum sojae]